MSADNGIYILRTKDKNGNFAYRVAHVHAIDNFNWYQDKYPQDFDAYVTQQWNDKVSMSRNQALCYAADLEEEYCTEYGMRVISADNPDYVHPFDR